MDEAERLGVKYVVSPECGHAYGAIRWAGPNLLGRSFGFEVIHIIELLDRLRAEGKLPVGDKDGRRMTLHDPLPDRAPGRVAEGTAQPAGRGVLEFRRDEGRRHRQSLLRRRGACRPTRVPRS
ncbi:hypothetical protein ACFOHS_09415 [Jhaorihella thermophila]